MYRYSSSLKTFSSILASSRLCQRQRFTFSNLPGKQEHNKTQTQNESKNDKREKHEKEDELIMKEISEYYEEQEIEELDKQSSKYSVIDRTYNETRVPGLDTRKYSDLTELQHEIISTHKFDLMNTQVHPKTGSSNTYAGISENLTEITLGGVKIKGENEVFLSEIDPENIPADLYIRFDNDKELKVVGKQTTKIKNKSEENPNSLNSHVMQIQPDTVEQKTMQEHMEDEFGMGFKSFGYNNKKRFTRWNVLVGLIFVSFLGPIMDTYSELRRFYTSTKEIEEERMKEVWILKKASFQKVLLENKDFNRATQ